MARICIIGGGIGGLASACLLGARGHEVTLYEKNTQLGGRANRFEAEGFTFDMGPSWYLMPDVFENFFHLLGERVEEHLTLTKLSPSYRIFFKEDGSTVDMYSDLNTDIPTLEALEAGVGPRLKSYLSNAQQQYEIAKAEFMYKNYDSLLDFINLRSLIYGSKLSVFSPMESYVSRYFTSEKVKKIIQYPLVFLGSSPYKTPALYSIMNHIDFEMGVYYPQGGMYEVVKALVRIAQKHGVIFHTETEVSRIITTHKRATGVELGNGERVSYDMVVSNGDIHYTETQLLAPEDRQFSQKYWEMRTLAPSALIMYLGVKKTFDSLTHHNLLFSEDWKQNFAEIFDDPQWPTDPSLYVCAPSKTDPTVAPEGHENLFVLVPVASGLEYTEKGLEHYAERMLDTLEEHMNLPGLKENVIYKRLYSVEDFARDYYSYQGTALGLAHTMRQTAIFRPNNVSRTVDNLFYVGANTNPGIGVPICLISAEMVYKRIAGIDIDAPLADVLSSK